MKNPQEVLLQGLGNAIKIFPQLRSALKVAEPEAIYIDTKEAINYIQYTSLQLQSAGFISLIPKGKSEKNIKKPTINLQLNPISQGIISQKTILSFDWKIAIGGSNLTAEDLEMLVSAKEPLIYIRDNWVQVNAKEIENTISFFKRLEENGGIDLSSAIKLTSKSIVDNGLSISQVDGPEWFDELFTKYKKFELITPPDTLKAQLRPYQVSGYSWMVFMHSIGLNPCLADDMGLGKTIQCISVILYHVKNSKILNTNEIKHISNKTNMKRNSKIFNSINTLVVCPTSVMTNWGRELTKFAPSLNFDTYHGKDRRYLLTKPVDVLITSYGLIRRDIEFLKNYKFHLVVIDESQNIKNPFSGQSKAVRSLNAKHKVALTGTPIENRLSELWSLFDFLHPLYIGNLNQFLKYYSRSIELHKNSAIINELKQLITPFLLRRSKEDKSIIPDLPDKIESKVYSNLSKEQVSLYQSLVNSQLKLVKNSEGISRRGIILGTILKLKQICNHPAQFLKDGKLSEKRSEK
ncbi:MAG: DEAD/DEAH box helicase, partial [Candidatus Heimdallarchaeota archaeon]